jgi:hypothetical protein
MFKMKRNISREIPRTSAQHDRLDEILKAIDGLIFSIKMDTYQSVSSNRVVNFNKAMDDSSSQEMMARKSILFNLLPKDELYAITKKKSQNIS